MVKEHLFAPSLALTWRTILAGHGPAPHLRIKDLDADLARLSPPLQSGFGYPRRVPSRFCDGGVESGR